MTTPPLWMPGALRIESPRRNPLNNNGFRVLTWHTFEAGYSLTVRAALRYLINQGSEAFVFHPITGEWGQCQPMNTGARTLRSAPGVPTNRFGTVHQQVEVIGRAANPFTRDLTPEGRAGLARGLDFFRAWGIPDQWAWKNQPPPRYPGGSVRRRLPEQSGHAYHSGWPVNDHGDPGAIEAPWIAARSATPRPSGPPTLRQGDRGDRVAHLQGRLNLHGAALKVDGVFGPQTLAAVRTFQQAHRLDVDGVVGPATWATLSATPRPPKPPTTKEPDMPLTGTDLDKIRAIIRDELDHIETARTVWTRHPLVRDTRPGGDPEQRVTPSTLLEGHQQ